MTSETKDSETRDSETAAESSAEPAPSPAPATAARLRRAVGALLVLIGVAAAVLAGLVPFAAVDATTSTVTWPRAGDDPERPTPTTAFLVPYRPAELHAAIPCAALREAARRTGATTVLATTTAAAGRGLAVRADDGTLRLLVSGRGEAVTLPAGDCAMRVDADAAGVRATVGGREIVSRAGEPVPEVFAITTDLTGPPAAGLTLTARTPAWFATAPSPEKSALISWQLRLAVAAIALLFLVGVLDSTVASARGGRVGRVLAALRRPRNWALVAIDAAVVVGLVWWSLVGPMTDDDGFAAAIAREGPIDAPVTNYYRWFDASEAPFASAQQLLRLVGGADPLDLRTPSLLAGIALWFLVTRGVLRPGLGGRAGTSVTVRLATVAALGAWWLPYDLGTRPEPFVALGVTAVVVLVLRAIRPAAHHPRLALALAAGVAALTVTVAPSGVLGLAPFLLAAPRVWRAVRGSPLRVAETLAGAAAAVSVAVTVVFAIPSWHAVAVATSIHQQYGPSQPWYAEWLRYGYLLGDDSWGSATKRLPVLLAVVLAVPALVLLARRRRTAPESVVLLGLAPVGLALLALTPSKWSHHFGALAGFGAVSAVAVAVTLARAARDREPVLRVLGPVTALGVAAAVTVAFSGPNSWWGYSNAHVPWATGPVTPLAGVGRWLAAGAVIAVVVAVTAALRRRDVAVTTAALTPAVLATLAATTSVALLVTSFAAAAHPPPGTSTFGARNLAVARGATDCGVADRVQVLTTAAGGPLAPDGDGAADLDGFVAQGGWGAAPPARPGDTDDTRDGRYAWGSKTGGPGVGALTSPWFTLPRPGATQELALSVSGRTSDGESVTLEFERGTTPVGQRRVDEPPAPERDYRGYAGSAEQERLQDENRPVDAWRTVTVDRLPAGADRVRVLARDDSTEENGWVAVTGPRLVDVTPLRTYLATRAPVVVDWAVAFAWPCLTDRAPVHDGVAATPSAQIAAPVTNDPVPGARRVDDTIPSDLMPERWTLGTDALVTATALGASFAGVRVVGQVDEVDTRLAGEPARRWGRLLVPDYGDLARDAYDVRTTTARIGGAEGDPPPERVTTP